MDTNTSLLWAFLFLMIVNTVIGILTLIMRKEKPGKIVTVNNPEIEKCKIASMQLFVGLNALMDLMSGSKWNKDKTKCVIKEMEKEKERILGGQKTN